MYPERWKFPLLLVALVLCAALPATASFGHGHLGFWDQAPALEDGTEAKTTHDDGESHVDGMGPSATVADLRRFPASLDDNFGPALGLSHADGNSGPRQSRAPPSPGL